MICQGIYNEGSWNILMTHAMDTTVEMVNSINVSAPNHKSLKYYWEKQNVNMMK